MIWHRNNRATCVWPGKDDYEKWVDNKPGIRQKEGT